MNDRAYIPTPWVAANPTNYAATWIVTNMTNDFSDAWGTYNISQETFDHVYFRPDISTRIVEAAPSPEDTLRKSEKLLASLGIAIEE